MSKEACASNCLSSLPSYKSGVAVGYLSIVAESCVKSEIDAVVAIVGAVMLPNENTLASSRHAVNVIEAVP